MGRAEAPPAPKDIPVKFHTFLSSKIVLQVQEGDNSFDFDLAKL